MSDYLSNLVNRAYGRLPIVQPRRASLFEPAAPIVAPDVIEEAVASDVTGVAGTVGTAGPRAALASRVTGAVPMHTPQSAAATGTPARRAGVGQGHPAGHTVARAITPRPTRLVPGPAGDQPDIAQHQAAMPGAGPSEMGLLQESKSSKPGSAVAATSGIEAQEPTVQMVQRMTAEPFESFESNTPRETDGPVLQRATLTQSQTAPEMPHHQGQLSAPMAGDAGEDTRGMTATTWQPQTRPAFVDGNLGSPTGPLEMDVFVEAAQDIVAESRELDWVRSPGTIRGHGHRFPALAIAPAEGRDDVWPDALHAEADDSPRIHPSHRLRLPLDHAPRPGRMSDPTQRLSYSNADGDIEVRSLINAPALDDLDQHLRVALDESQAAPGFLPTIRASSRAIQIASRRTLPLASERPNAMPAPMTPNIQVTIGRVEVRANTPATPLRKPPASPAVMSLDDYLRTRNGGSQ